VVKAVSLPVAQAMTLFAGGRYGDTVDKLVPVQKELHHAGGSHAQRDVVTLTLIEAALRGKRNDLARALLHERTRARPTSPGSWRSFARVLEELHENGAAAKAREQAEALKKAS
jgi:predicted Zn-dependent protease